MALYGEWRDFVFHVCANYDVFSAGLGCDSKFQAHTWFSFIPYTAIYPLYYEYCCSRVYLPIIVEPKIRFGQRPARDRQHPTDTLAGKCLGQQSFSVLAGDLGLAWLQHGDHAGGFTNHPQ